MLTLLALWACTDEADTDPGDVVDACPPAVAPRTLATGFASGTEGVTASPDGVLYVTDRAGRLVVIADDGTVTPLAAVADPLGVTWWRGAAWVASGAANEGGPALVEVSPTGTTVVHAVPEIDAPNFLTPTPWGTLLVSDDRGDTVFEWRDGAVSEWTGGVPSPNGMGFSPDGATLYVASTFRDQGLWAVTIEGESAGSAQKLLAFEPTDAPDGLAIGADGSVYVALNLANTVVRWSDGQRSAVGAASTVASLAFRRPGSCELVATSLFGDEVTRLDAPTAGWWPAE